MSNQPKKVMNSSNLTAQIPSESKSSSNDDSYREKSFKEKYGPALKTLLPFRCIKPQNGILPNGDVGLCSYITLQWMDKWMWKASRHGVEVPDVDKLNERDSSYHNLQRLKRLWRKETDTYGIDKASFFRTIWHFNQTAILIASLMTVFSSILIFITSTWTLKSFLNYINTPNLPMWHGMVLTFAISTAILLKQFAYNTMWPVVTTSGIRTMAAIQTLIYKKILISETCGEKLLSEVVNYITTDLERIFQATVNVCISVGVPIMMPMGLVYCYLVWGPWSLLGSFLILSFCLVMVLIGKRMSQLRNNISKVSDERIKLINQVITGIKLIKMNTWEKAFIKKINKIRNQEEKMLKTLCFLQSISGSFPLALTVISPMASIIGLTLTGNNLQTPEVFSILGAFSCYHYVITTMPQAIRMISEGLVGCGRIQKMLTENDICITEDKTELKSKHAIEINNLDAGWPAQMSANLARHKNLLPTIKNTTALSKDTTIKLQDNDRLITTLNKINLTVEKGQLLGICGHVGAGKSSLLSVISGTGMFYHGNIVTEGKMAYVTQSAWMFNATIRQNIIFGLPYDEDRYKQTLFECCLESDIRLMPNEDYTEIAERGINLSGGQKQRINLARALYSNRDIYLLDDIFSSVDNKVANHIFVHGIKEALIKKSKTVLLVTHAKPFLEQSDHVILMTSGTIVESGTHAELIQQSSKYQQMFEADDNKKRIKKRRCSQTNDKDIIHYNAECEKSANNGTPITPVTLVKTEVDKNTGLTLKTWLYYCKKCGGYIITSLVLLTIIVFDLLVVITGVWVQIWMDAGCAPYNVSTANEYIINKNSPMKNYAAIYGALGVALILLGLIKALLIGKVMLKGVTAIHHIMFEKILRSPLSFFDVTPHGRVINRFSKDMDELDAQIPPLSEATCQIAILLSFQLILLCIYFHFYIVVIVLVLTVIFLICDEVFNAGVNSTKRVENLLRSPLLIHLTSTIDGIATIRCYQIQKLMTEKFQMLVDQHSAAYFLFQLSTKWIGFRIIQLPWIAIIATCLIAVLTKGQASVAAVGLSLVQVIRIHSSLTVYNRWKLELMAKMISLERIVDYCKNLPEESNTENGTQLAPDWPQEGKIILSDVKLRYHPDLPLILHGISVTINGGENIGVFGRTGAGKSSIINAILRFTELCGGKVTIDGIDISKISLEDLRSKISTISQEPRIFEGTVRWNLDPDGRKTDEELWEALEKTHLKEKISKEPAKLDTLLSTESAIFSLGEMQLFCLSRALIRRNKILLLDEATASVDVETERIIQQTIRESFAHCTTIKIAHRLHTIMDCDRVIGMEAGQVVEVDSPQKLLSMESHFHSAIEAQ